ncbi:hypothetical protein [Bacillus cereus]
MKSININGNIYHIESVPFEDKSEQDEEEEIIYFLKNPSLAFGKDFEAIKVYIIKEYDVNKFKIPGEKKPI